MCVCTSRRPGSSALCACVCRRRRHFVFRASIRAVYEIKCRGERRAFYELFCPPRIAVGCSWRALALGILYSWGCGVFLSGGVCVFEGDVGVKWRGALVGWLRVVGVGMASVLMRTKYIDRVELWANWDWQKNYEKCNEVYGKNVIWRYSLCISFPFGY